MKKWRMMKEWQLEMVKLTDNVTLNRLHVDDRERKFQKWDNRGSALVGTYLRDWKKSKDISVAATAQRK